MNQKVKSNTFQGQKFQVTNVQTGSDNSNYSPEKVFNFLQLQSQHKQ